MSTLYKIIGEDGREYGWVEAGQLRQWIAENRVERQTPVFVDGAKDWNFVGRLPEFAGDFTGGAPHTIAPPPGSSTAGRMPRINPFATAGLICGILSLTCCCGFPFNLLGLVFSLIAMSQISRHPELYEGRGIALAGLILSIASLVLGIGLVLLNLALHPSNVMWHFKTF